MECFSNLIVVAIVPASSLNCTGLLFAGERGGVSVTLNAISQWPRHRLIVGCLSTQGHLESEESFREQKAYTWMQACLPCFYYNKLVKNASTPVCLVMQNCTKCKYYTIKTNIRKFWCICDHIFLILFNTSHAKWSSNGKETGNYKKCD